MRSRKWHRLLLTFSTNASPLSVDSNPNAAAIVACHASAPGLLIHTCAASSS
jgi:hypothetical protein